MLSCVGSVRHIGVPEADGETLRVLIDTNVWISALINPHGRPAQIIEMLRQGFFVPVLSQPLFDEISEVMQRVRIRRRWQDNEASVQQTLGLLRQIAVDPAPPGNVRVCRDPHDDFILETAILGEAHYVVSRDEDITRDPEVASYLGDRGIALLTVARFIDLLETRTRR